MATTTIRARRHAIPRTLASYAAQFFSRLASFSRLILFDKRGTGLSDRDVGIATLEERMDDVRAVMDAAGSKSAALFGFSEGGAMSMLFASMNLFLLAVQPNISLAVVFTGGLGFFVGTMWVTGYTMLQENVTDEFRGRTFGAITVVLLERRASTTSG